MSTKERISLGDIEHLSAYLDGALSKKEATRLEARLRQEPELGRMLAELRRTSELLRHLPTVRPPRSFALTPDMVGLRPRRPVYPILRLAAVVAAMAFVSVVGVDTLVLRMAPSMAPEYALPVEAPLAGEQMMAAEIAVEEATATPPVEATAEAGMLMQALPTLAQAEACVEGELQTDQAKCATEGTMVPPPAAPAAEQRTATPQALGEGAGEEAPSADRVAPAEGPEEAGRAAVPSTQWTIIRSMEVGLGLATALLLALALYSRRRAQ